MMATFTSELSVVMLAVAPNWRDGVPLLGVGPMLEVVAVQTLVAEAELPGSVVEVLDGVVLVSVDVAGPDDVVDPPSLVVTEFAVGCAMSGADGPQPLSPIIRPAAAAAAVVVRARCFIVGLPSR